MPDFYLRDLAHSRAGDKGDTSNIGVIAYRPAYYPTILKQVTVDRVRTHFRGLVQGPVTRYELPNVQAVNFVLERSLGGGVTRSLSLDPHGKSYSALILTMAVSVDETLYRMLVQDGRTPLDGQGSKARPMPSSTPNLASAARAAETFSAACVSPVRVRLSVAQAAELARNSLRAAGYDDEESRIISDHLLDAALCGYEYSGLPKVLQIAANPKARATRRPMSVLHETPVSVLCDGGNNVGMLTLHHATDMAIAKAREHGFALVGVTNSWMSGRSAHYVERIARADLIGMHTVGSASLVAPPGGTRPALGTNPIAFGFPSAGEPLVIDIGTAAIMGTELELLERLGMPIPENVAIDASGQPTRDAGAARRGAFLPFGGHKGFALGIAMQALGVLAGSGLNAAKDYGYLLVVIRPDLLVPLETFKNDLSELIRRVKATPRQPGVDEIRIPSERAFRQRARGLKEGIEIDERILDQLEALGTGNSP